jgi:hypothetical protein
MATLVREAPLPNGLTVLFYDRTRRYFGDFYLVKLEIVCNIPIIREYFAGEDELREARALLGEKVVYRREIEQMGVPSTEIGRVRDRLAADFEKHSIPYFAAPAFPQKLVAAELRKMKKKTHRLPLPGS